eukprot:Amastigsp_a841667_33.p2 type:complete len:121 gc:universal Amastigsp_a841667_33:711-349(-)
MSSLRHGPQRPRPRDFPRVSIVTWWTSADKEACFRLSTRRPQRDGNRLLRSVHTTTASAFQIHALLRAQQPPLHIAFAAMRRFAEFRRQMSSVSSDQVAKCRYLLRIRRLSSLLPSRTLS